MNEIIALGLIAVLAILMEIHQRNYSGEYLLCKCGSGLLVNECIEGGECCG